MATEITLFLLSAQSLDTNIRTAAEASLKQYQELRMLRSAVRAKDAKDVCCGCQSFNFSHIKSSGENSIHIIPNVLIVCAITLWVFSHPVVDLTKTADVAAVKVEGANIHNHGNKTGLSST
ncbi:hypothetical protein IFM89_022167 [Coptis chinensis]|uniref:Uncharacterized protein n=1 Tax=Coptis chinensis TaxID=261450 RepID=A0A835MAH1_9MAGN|nr:hypothetical protein IFM89_022167 [Coptis chinensis]